jgi:hypothetical protein
MHSSSRMSQKKMTTSTQRLQVHGELPGWLTGTVSRWMATEDEALHTFSLRGGVVTHAARPIATRSQTYLSDPARARFRSVVSHFSHAPADHARAAQMRASAVLEAYAAQPIPLALNAAHYAKIGIAPPTAQTQTSGAWSAQARLMQGDVEIFRSRARGVDHVASFPVSAAPYLPLVCATRRYLVLILTPHMLSAPFGSAGTLAAHYTWQPERGASFVVFERESGKLVTSWEADAFFALHSFHAFERGDELMVDLVAYPDARILENAPLPSSELRRYRLMPGARRATYEALSSISIELPRGAQGVTGEPRWVYGVSLRGGEIAHAYDQLVKIDLHSGRDRIWTAAGCRPGEPILVQRPGARSDDDGMVLSVVWDAGSGASFLLALDAASFTEIGRAGFTQRPIPRPEHHRSFALVY